MTAQDTSILAMYEELDLSLEQISSETGFDVEAIKISLLQNSTRFSKEARHSISRVPKPQTPTRQSEQQDAYPVFSMADEELAKKTLRSICENGELEVCRTSAARTILKLNQEERASKRATIVGRTNFNIQIIQDNLARAKRATSLQVKAPTDLIELESQLT